MGWFTVAQKIKSEDYEGLREYLRGEVDPGRTLEVACREIIFDEIPGADLRIDPGKARYEQLLEQARARMEAAGV